MVIPMNGSARALLNTWVSNNMEHMNEEEKLRFRNCEEGKIRFRKAGYGEYMVYSDCLTGKMEFIGYVERNDRLMRGYHWDGRIPGSQKQFLSNTRIGAVKLMLGESV